MDVEVHPVGALTAVVGPTTLSRLQAAVASNLTAQDVISRLKSSMPIEGVEHLKETSATTIIYKLRQTFARHGIPLEVCSDGSPQFASKEFKDFGARYDFVHTISSTRFPRSNVLAEKGVQAVKRLLGQTKTKKDDFYLGLLNYRADHSDDAPDSSPSAVTQQRQEPPQATQDRPPAGVPNIADSLRRSTRPRRPPDRLAYTHGFQLTETT
ncbi:uncharacterized protein LOC119444293 [Dermacentor silvarum]|uniref:uncharacterized protein LOC119444293 n=1 Tax=Dermacentor silvarum TaxID=543639 RepID=UPI001896D680|nr:uncharacterized protein LOC119444293 [Dermacentor silvarum]